MLIPAYKLSITKMTVIYNQITAIYMFIVTVQPWIKKRGHHACMNGIVL